MCDLGLITLSGIRTLMIEGLSPSPEEAGDVKRRMEMGV
jgi:hypothetical protein